MIQAIRHNGDLPGGVPAMLVTDGEHLFVVFSRKAADDPNGAWRFDLCNSLVDEVQHSGGDYAIDSAIAVVMDEQHLPASMLMVS